MSYGELEQLTNQLAHRLIQLGVGPEVPVGVMMPRSLDLIVAFYGVVKAGGAYVPMDPAYPPERLAIMLEDSEVCSLTHLMAILCWLTPLATRMHKLVLVSAGTSHAKSEGGVCQARQEHHSACAVGAPKADEELPAQGACRKHCCNLFSELVQNSLFYATCKCRGANIRQLANLCSPGLFSSTKSAMSLPSSQPRPWAAAQAPQTCATSSSRLEARGDPRAPSCSTTAPSASCMTWSRALAFRRSSLPPAGRVDSQHFRW